MTQTYRGGRRGILEVIHIESRLGIVWYYCKATLYSPCLSDADWPFALPSLRQRRRDEEAACRALKSIAYSSNLVSYPLDSCTKSSFFKYSFLHRHTVDVALLL